MICQGLALVGFVFTVGAVELKDASVSILTVLHLVKAHISMSTLITPEFWNYMFEEVLKHIQQSIFLNLLVCLGCLGVLFLVSTASPMKLGLQAGTAQL